MIPAMEGFFQFMALNNWGEFMVHLNKQKTLCLLTGAKKGEKAWKSKH